MSLHDYLHFNRDCPICKEPLDLYMQWHHSTLWKAHQTDPNTYVFKPFKLKKNGLKDEDTITLQEDDKGIHTYFGNSEVSDNFKTQTVHFFFLCNEKGIVDKGEPAYDYEIVLYRGCYYRSSAEYNMKQMSRKRWSLLPASDGDEGLINKEESFSFKDVTEEIEKVYALSLKSSDDLTKLWYYSATPEEKKDENFEPKVFEKDLPLLTVRPQFDLEHREKLLDRFNSWIIMS